MLFYLALALWLAGAVLVLTGRHRSGGSSAIGFFTFTGLMLGAVVGLLSPLGGTAAAFGGGLGLLLGAVWDRSRARQ
ncbi:MAG: hypothetical protein ACFB22_03850 [Rhodothalassiaceae bacterium]